LSLAGYVVRYWVYVEGACGVMRPHMCHGSMASAVADARAAGGTVLEETAC